MEKTSRVGSEERQKASSSGKYYFNCWLSFSFVFSSGICPSLMHVLMSGNLIIVMVSEWSYGV